MEAAGHPVIRDETYRYALDDKKNRIEGYYKGMADNRRYGLEFPSALAATWRYGMPYEWTSP